jgi:acyl carrier protein
MGMDGVEIVLRVEEAFDIRIEDAEAGSIRTPGQLIELIRSKITSVESSACLNHKAFNRVRRFILQRYNINRGAITPRTVLASIVTKKDRKQFLADLRTELQIYYKPPGLVAPRWFHLLYPAFVLLAGLCGGWWAYRDAHANAIAGGFAGAALLALLVSLLGLKLLATQFPETIATVGDLALWVKTYKPDLIHDLKKAWTKEQIADAVRGIVTDVLGCQKAYREEARFVEDLGMD